MECPRCGSENITHSHRRGLEKIVRFFYPRTPYRCKECWTRFWKFENPLQTLGGKIAALLMILLIGAGVSYMIWFRGSDDPPVAKKESYKIPDKAADTERIKKSVPKPEEKMPIFPEEKPLEAAEKQPSQIKPETPAGAEQKIPLPVRAQENKSVAVKIPQPPAPVQKEAAENKSSVKKSVAVKPPVSSVPVTNPAAENKSSVKISEKPEILPSVESVPKAAQAVQASASEDVSEKKTFMTLKDIRSQSSEGSFSIMLFANAPIEKYKTVALNPPPKLVLDLPGKWSYSGNSVISVQSDLVEKIRVGEHKDKLRLVIDLKGSRTYSPRIEPSPEGLTFTIKK